MKTRRTVLLLTSMALTLLLACGAALAQEGRPAGDDAGRRRRWWKASKRNG